MDPFELFQTKLILILKKKGFIEIVREGIEYSFKFSFCKLADIAAEILMEILERLLPNILNIFKSKFERIAHENSIFSIIYDLIIEMAETTNEILIYLKAALDILKKLLRKAKEIFTRGNENFTDTKSENISGNDKVENKESNVITTKIKNEVDGGETNVSTRETGSGDSVRNLATAEIENRGLRVRRNLSGPDARNRSGNVRNISITEIEDKAISVKRNVVLTEVRNRTGNERNVVSTEVRNITGNERNVVLTEVRNRTGNERNVVSTEVRNRTGNERNVVLTEVRNITGNERNVVLTEVRNRTGNERNVVLTEVRNRTGNERNVSRTKKTTHTSKRIGFFTETREHNTTTKEIIMVDKQRYITGTRKINKTKFVGVEKKIWYYVGGVIKATSEQDIIDYLEENIPNRTFTCTKLCTKGSTQSFKISADESLKMILEKPEFWPSNIKVRPFEFKPRYQKNTHIVSTGQNVMRNICLTA